MSVRIRKNAERSGRWDMIKVEEIKVDDRTQPRASLDSATVAEYMERMQKPQNGGPIRDLEDRPFEPIKVFRDGDVYWLADGFHRVEAALKKRISVIQADVESGTLRDAIRFSLSANARHGLRRTNADKRRAVERALCDEEWVKLSDNKLGKMCAVSRPFVGKVRAELERVGTISVQSTRIDAQGNEYEVDDVGARAYLRMQREEREKRAAKEVASPLPTASASAALGVKPAQPRKPEQRAKPGTKTRRTRRRAAAEVKAPEPTFQPELEVVSFAGLERMESEFGVIVAHPGSIQDWIVLGKQLRSRLEVGGHLVVTAPAGERAFAGAVQLHAFIRRSDIQGPVYVVVGEERAVYAVWSRGDAPEIRVSENPDVMLSQLGDAKTRYLVVGQPDE